MSSIWYKKFQILLWGICAYLIFSCSPQKRLNRLIKNNPELAKIDTLFIDKITTVTGTKIDTSVIVSYNVNGLDSIFNTYKNKIDSLQAVLLKKEVKTYIINRKCLEDTFKVTLKNGGWCKIYQSDKKFVYQMYEPDKIVKIKVPYYVSKIVPVIKNNWLWFFYGLITSLLALFLIKTIFRTN